MRITGTILIIFGLILGGFGLRSYWRDYTYRKANIAVQATVKSVRIEQIRSGLSNILYTLVYTRDGVQDSTNHKITESYTIKNPLPTIEQLRSATLYVHYVPAEKRRYTAFPSRVIVSSDGVYEGFYSRGLFGQMFTFILMGLIFRLWGRKPSKLS